MSPVEIFEGEPLQLTCTFVATPDLEIEWSRNGGVLASGDSIQITYENGICTLSIAAATLADVGDYCCKAINSAGSADTTGKVTVKAKDEASPTIVDGEAEAAPAAGELPPYVLSHLQGQIVKDGDALNLECQIGGAAPLDVIWLKNGKEIKPSDEFKYEHDGVMYRLKIAEVFPEDTGLFSCEALNKIGEATTSCFVRVDVPDEAPKGPVFQTFPQAVTIEEGASAKFTCKVASKSQAKVSWLKGKSELEKENDRFKFSEEKNEFTLEITSALSTDSDRYSVKAVDEEGESRWVFTISVLASEKFGGAYIKALLQQ